MRRTWLAGCIASNQTPRRLLQSSCVTWRCVASVAAQEVLLFAVKAPHRRRCFLWSVEVVGWRARPEEVLHQRGRVGRGRDGGVWHDARPAHVAPHTRQRPAALGHGTVQVIPRVHAQPIVWLRPLRWARSGRARARLGACCCMSCRCQCYCCLWRAAAARSPPPRLQVCVRTRLVGHGSRRASQVAAKRSETAEGHFFLRRRRRHRHRQRHRLRHGRAYWLASRRCAASDKRRRAPRLRCLCSHILASLCAQVAPPVAVPRHDTEWCTTLLVSMQYAIQEREF